MRKIILLVLISLSLQGYSQSLSPERVKHIKECTVRITIEGDNSIGTAFFIDNNVLLTCWHVIKPAILDDNNNFYPTFKKIYATLSDGQKIEFGIPTKWITKETYSGMAYDFCPLMPVNSLDLVTHPFLNLGSVNDYSEGDDVYTCGYPLAISQQFITKGFISNKYTDSTILSNGNFNIKTPINLILMDMTMNRGNSGGAIVKIGSTPSEDKVIGIADFIINPIGSQADTVIKILNQNSGGVFIGVVDPIKTLSGLTQLLSSTTNGISGAISVEYWLKSLANLK